jgi:excisionase family DNA binding protein
VVYPGDGQAVTRLAYSPDEAAELLGISRELINDLLRTGDLRSVTAGRRRLISKIALSEYLHDDPGSGSGQGSLIQEIAALPRLAYSPEEVMIVLGIGKTMFFDLTASGELGSVKHGGRRFVSRAHLDAFLEDES